LPPLLRDTRLRVLAELTTYTIVSAPLGRHESSKEPP